MQGESARRIAEMFAVAAFERTLHETAAAMPVV
jgi:hypothetical protein